MIATHLGIHSSLSAWSDVNTVLPSIGIPGGTKGTEPVAIITSRAVTVPPTSTRPGREYLTSWGPFLREDVRFEGGVGGRGGERERREKVSFFPPLFRRKTKRFFQN